jgi:hypothetical protein
MAVGELFCNRNENRICQTFDKRIIASSAFLLQWTPNNSELGLRHIKRGREDGKDKGEQDCKESVWAFKLIQKTFFPF